MGKHILWYEKKASEWNEALPIGNGRLGGMIFGNPCNERIQVNEDSVWYGGPMHRNNEHTKEMLPKIRELILAGKISDAERLCKMAMGGTPQGMRIYQTLGDLELNFNLDERKISSYKRWLDIDEAVCGVSFTIDDTLYTREYFMSEPDDAMIIRCLAEGSKKMSLDLIQTRHHMYDFAKKYDNSSIILGGNLGRDGIDYAMMCRAYSPDGKVEVIGESIYVTDASEIILYWSAFTTFRIPESEASKQPKYAQLPAKLEDILTKVYAKKYEAIKKSHIDDYHSFYNRMDLSLSNDMDSLCDASFLLPTDMRLKNYAQGENTTSLEELYFHFGRYLLISCSRPGTLPANLQGIWNKDIEAPWDSKYTININTQMNYWPAEGCDLGDCHQPLFDLIKRMVPNGQQTAKEMYGCRGFVAHHNTDIWGDTAPQDLWIPGTFWVMGAAWLCTHLWMHYEYTMDEAFLKEYFPIMRKAAAFFLDFCIEHNGYLCTCPSVSPENTFILPNGEQGANTIGVTMDNQILHDLFTQCHKAAVILKEEDELDQQIVEAAHKLMPTQITSDGRIREWSEEYQELDPGHRHISHLYGLHPSDQITMDGTPALAKAAAKTLETRLKNGGGHTGWSRAWIINHYAKLWNSEKAYENLNQLIIKSTLPNLFDNHPPFQIDGNFGSIAGMIEMLVQSNSDRIVLLPALPDTWKNGKLTGVKVRGNAKLNIIWEDGKLKEASIYSGETVQRKVIYHGICKIFDLQKNTWIPLLFA